MEETTRDTLSRHLIAVKALLKSSEKALLQGLYDGTSQTLLRQYQLLQPKISELLPDDFYVKEMLTLEVAAGASEEEKVGLVRLLCDQMVEYLNGVLRAERGVISGDLTDVKNLGRDLQDQVLNVTKKALQRALSHIEITVDSDVPTPPTPPTPPIPTVRGVWQDIPEPPTPPNTGIPPIQSDDEQ